MPSSDKDNNVSTRKSWWRQAVVYNIYVPSFMDADHDGIGDFGGVLMRLPYLARLGVDTIILTNEEIDGDGQTDDIKCEELESLVAAAEERKIKVIVGHNLLTTCKGEGVRSYALPANVIEAMKPWWLMYAESGKAQNNNTYTWLNTPQKKGIKLLNLRENPSKNEDTSLQLQTLKNYYINWMKECGAEHWMTLFLENAEMPRILTRLHVNPLYRNTLAKLLATMLFTLRGTPVLYQGQELGLTSARFGQAANLHDATSILQLKAATEHAKTPMPWNNAINAGFTGGAPWLRMPEGMERLNVAVQMEDEASVWQHYNNLITLRKQAMCLVYGSFKPVFERNKKTFCYFRIFEGRKWYIEINLTECEQARPGRIFNVHELAVSNYNTLAGTLRPYEANLFRCEAGA